MYRLLEGHVRTQLRRRLRQGEQSPSPGLPSLPYHVYRLHVIVKICGKTDLSRRSGNAQESIVIQGSSKAASNGKLG